MLSEDEPTAEISHLNVQVTVLEMIAEISGNKKSALAFESVVKNVIGIVVGIACIGIGGLRDAYVNAFRGIASIDPDLIWLILAHVYYFHHCHQLIIYHHFDTCVVANVVLKMRNTK
ncbi:Armadillo-like helical [Artemisia annua]|uniref:Armadillo-like helical n=1 Tax=Artemisia annua TaxID=35608 RepID=A0A2U1QL94_ARTAN|nr:Armadillo-like helical [Artemisia annua]